MMGSAERVIVAALRELISGFLISLCLFQHVIVHTLSEIELNIIQINILYIELQFIFSGREK